MGGTMTNSVYSQHTIVRDLCYDPLPVQYTVVSDVLVDMEGCTIRTLTALQPIGKKSTFF